MSNCLNVRTSRMIRPVTTKNDRGEHLKTRLLGPATLLSTSFIIVLLLVSDRAAWTASDPLKNYHQGASDSSDSRADPFAKFRGPSCLRSLLSNQIWDPLAFGEDSSHF